MSGSEELVNLTIDGLAVSVPRGTLVIRAAEQIGVQIPRFCDHPLLAPVGACRQCLVEVAMPGPDGELRQMQGPPGRMKPQASCTLPVSEGMEVRTAISSPGAAKAQEGVMELLLVNHPLDCPVCDKGGECPLQNQAMSTGRPESRFSASGGVKRTFAKPISLSAQVLLDRERCVMCARCTRFASEIAGDPFITLVERGAQQQVGINPDHLFNSYFSGNTIQICPVGALTSVEYRFRSRPFDLVSSPGVAEHDACGAAIRVDHRRGRVMRRLSGDDPQVNQEWISDKDRFGFAHTRTDVRLRHPLVRDPQTGEQRPASWTEAFAVAARGLAAAGDVGLLPGGRLTAEDGYAWSKFARLALGTNDVDFRSRAHSAEETDFLTTSVALQLTPSYDDLAAADTVLLAGLEVEEDAGTLFLRLRAMTGRGLQVLSLAPWTTPGLAKLGGRRIDTVPGTEARVLAGLDSELTERSVLLLGERLATSPGALAAARALAERTGARWAWVPRRAGERGAVEVGLLPGLLPGGRPVTEAAARVDLALAWGVESLPREVGRDAAAIVDAAVAGELGALVLGGFEVDDTPDPAALRRAVDRAGFVVCLEQRETALTRAADVVLPVASVTEKAGTFITWDARARGFEACLESASAVPDLRILAGIAEELGRPLGFRTVPETRAEMIALGPWDSTTPANPLAAPPTATTAAPAPTDQPGPGADRPGRFTLASWRLMLDDSALLDGADALRATARPVVARLARTDWEALGSPAGVTVTGGRGSVSLPVEPVDDMVAGVVWLPTRSTGRGLWADLTAPEQRLVDVTAAPEVD